MPKWVDNVTDYLQTIEVVGWDVIKPRTGWCEGQLWRWPRPTPGSSTFSSVTHTTIVQLQDFEFGATCGRKSDLTKTD